MNVTKRDGDVTDDLRIGQVLGDYRILRVLANGGIARVYEAEDTRLGRLAAVKVLEPEKLANDESLTRRFQREARAVALLEHDNIIHIYQYGEQDGCYFIAMKLIRGHDLAQEFRKYRRSGSYIEVERILHILGQVADALDYAHQHNVIHRDVKPSNILIDANDKATLTDFGLVMSQAIDATMGTAFGTPRYIAPEQALASNSAVPQSDIYSLGIVLYEALTGEVPFTGNTPMEIAISQVSDPPRPPRSLNPNIPPAAEVELLRVLEKDPMLRHPSARMFINQMRCAYGFPVQEARTTVILSQTATDSSPTIPSSPTLTQPPIYPTQPTLVERRAMSPVVIAALVVAAMMVVVVVVLFLAQGG